MKSLSLHLHKALLTLVSWIKVKVDEPHYELTVKLAGEKLFKPREDDIFIVSSPKSGTTLLQMMLYQLTSEGTVDFPHITTVSPWYDMPLFHGRADLLEAAPSPRLLKSHSPWESLPRSGKFVYVARNVRDVAISCFHHTELIIGMDPQLEAYLDIFLKHDLWFKDMVSWWPHRHDENVLFLFFDEVVGDLEGTFRRVAEFLNLEIDEEKVPRILERCSLGFMKQHNEKFDPRRARIISVPENELFARSLATDGSDRLATDQEERLAERLRALTEEIDWPGDDRDARALCFG